MPWGDDPNDRGWLEAQLRAARAKTLAVEADLSTVTGPAHVFDAVERALGGVTALVLCHVVDVEAGLLDTTVENFDRAMARECPGKLVAPPRIRASLQGRTRARPDRWHHQ